MSAAAARAHIGRDLMQIRERIAELHRERNSLVCSFGGRSEKVLSVAGELAGLRYAEQLLGVTLARLHPEEASEITDRRTADAAHARIEIELRNRQKESAGG